jgi:outer membrane lipoprotein SlyB
MGKAFVWTTTLLVGVAMIPGIFGEGARPGFANSVSANAAAQTKKRITVPAGTRILIRMVDSIDSTKQKTGDRFTASLETNLQAEDTVVAPRGSTLYGRLAQASSAGRMSGSSELTLELTDIVINGTAYPLLTSTYEVKGQGEGGKTAKKVVGGAGLGALIGGIAGGGKGAGIGAAAGAATGTAVAGAKKGQQLQIPSETLLEFRLQQPVSLPAAG